MTELLQKKKVELETNRCVKSFKLKIQFETNKYKILVTRINEARNMLNIYR